MDNVLSRAEILCVGTELLIGDIVNTNAAYLSRRLAALGIGVYRQSVVGDNRARLAEDLRAALSRADLVITSGGLGPTADDMTKEIAAEVFGRGMALHEPSLARIERYFAATGRVMTPNNRKQAMMPEGAIVFDNDYGTAPALALVSDEGKILVLLPGPPRELEPLFCEKVEPFLRPRCGAILFSRNVHICGMGESAVEAALPPALLSSANPTVAPYCIAGEVRLRVTAKAEDEQLAAQLCDRAVEQIKQTPVGEYIYAIDTPSPEAALVQLLLEKGLTVAAAESCTGGLIAKRLTDVAGSSGAVVGGVVTYQTPSKTALLGVPAALIEAHGVVSAEVAAAMAEGARARLGADIAIATTGYAGPGGGDTQNPVGTVYLAVAGGKGTAVRRFNASPLRDRAYIRTVAATNAILDALRYLFDVQSN
ncbi:MAG: competence/damage-inducible protein A [Clostridia bacterium]|nr:competence/damage-inducible protein A [Clostridia bacterium]